MDNKLIRVVSRMDSHHRLITALIVTGVAGLFFSTHLLWQTRVVLFWTVFTFALLSLIWCAFFYVHPRQLPNLARLQDSSRLFIFALVLGSAAGSLGAVLALLAEVKAMSTGEAGNHLLLSVLSVGGSWLLIHSLFGLRYAHLYYTGTHQKGLDFPATKEPDYLDFAYFSFIIGMTSQVSDVQITSSSVRRLALLHGLLAYLFNAVVIALTINVIASLLQG